MKNINILLTGGCGYIGSHVYVALCNLGHTPIIFDNLSNSNINVLQSLQSLTGKTPAFVQGDVRDASALDAIFKQYNIAEVMHFAGLKAVGESVAEPLRYYDNNVVGSICLLQAMQRAHVHKMVFSSSATVYQDPAPVPIPEDAPRAAANPYGRSKLMIEDMLADACAANSHLSVARLRYFNPVGAHSSGLIGESPLGVPNNLMPYIGQVALGMHSHVNVYGNDYPTIDGTGVRDYIHVCDLADGHIAALQYLRTHTGLLTLNLGTGAGISVLQLVEAFKKASGVPIAHVMAPRRAGDVAVSYANTSAAEKILGFKTRYTVDDACADAYRFINNKR